jgi:tRNA A-37 threonylcarbamoyl transferase component Bud32
MESDASDNQLESSTAGRRYAVAEELGAGGVATVYRVSDTVAKRDVALKRLRFAPDVDTKRSELLFRQEFYTLSQLAHPNVVSVYDYGIDDEGPYYTMELLDGGDLLKLAPCDWRKVCALAKDVCSALALVHSRRLVYRDLSPRNVRCTGDGRAKLLDFGALAPMGHAKSFVGTPAVSPPEAVHFQSLDARADLYSLGATFYYALTKRRPYAANSLGQLSEAWRHSPAPPSEIVPGIPALLDALILELLQLDRAHRPASAAETMDRLSAIAGLGRDELPVSVYNAYLSMPTLVGRDASLGRFRRRLESALGGRGTAMVVTGPRGVGRTRFLDACVLDAKLSGVVALRADAASSSGDHGVAGALGGELLEALPELARASAAPWLDSLSQIAPALRSPTDPAPARRDDATAAPKIGSAVRDWILSVARQRPLMVAVDDVHRADALSMSLVAMLGRAAPECPLIVAATTPSDDGGSYSSALELIMSQSYPMRLGALTVKRSERLLRSVFGDVPNVRRVAQRLQTVSKGLPRDLMQLAQQLVDTRVVRYESGAWVLPPTFDSDVLPSDMAQARRARVASLGHDALVIARALALGPDGSYSFDECLALTEHGDASRLMPGLSELVRAEIVSWSSSDYSLTRLGWREPLLASLDPSVRRSLCSRLARVFERRENDGFHSAKYLIAAGEDERGLDELLRFSVASVRETTLSMGAFEKLLQSLPEDWLSLFDLGLELCKQYRRRPEEAMNLYERVTGIASQLPFDATKYFAPVFEQLVMDSGLDVYATLDASLDPSVRLRKSFAIAGERQKGRAAGEHSFDPPTAVRLLGRMVARAIGSVSTSLSIPLLKLIPSLSPLVTLSPAFGAWQTLVDGVAARMLSQRERARTIYVRQLARLSAADRAGLDETYRLTQVLGVNLGLGTLEAQMGLASSLDRAKVLQSSPLHEVNAVRVRMLHYLWQGDTAESDKCKNQAELLAVEHVRRQTNEGAHLLGELLANALSDDLTRVKRTMDAVEPLAAKAAGWQPVLHWGRAEYQRIRGDYANALGEVEKSLRSMDPMGHPAWPEVAAARLSILLGQGRSEDVRTIGEGYLREAKERGFGFETNYIRMPLAIALSRLGSRESALLHSEAVIRSFEALGSTGLNLGLAYETRARICIQLEDHDGFDQYAALCARQYRSGSSGPLAAKFERLKRDAQRATKFAPRASGSEGDIDVVTILDGCESRNARAKRMLEVLLQASGATEGVLFGMEAGAPALLARVGEKELPAEVIDSALDYLVRECRPDDLTVLTDHTSEMKSEWSTAGGELYRPVLLSHWVDGALTVTGLAVLVTGPKKPYRHPAAAAEVSSRVLSDHR